MTWKIHNEDCLDTLAFMCDESVDLTVTSPPYDNIRTYNGYCFNFEETARELYRVTKIGGVVVWIVNDAIIDGSKTGTSFRQALFFKSVGFNIHDTMIWNKQAFSAVGSLSVRYGPVFEFMFVLSKGRIKTFNQIRDRVNKHGGSTISGTIRLPNGKIKAMSSVGKTIAALGARFNIWEIYPQRQAGRNKHPAPFPEPLARDHVISWSNPGDLVFDPFTGSGTTGKMAVALGRNFIGSEISDEYAQMARARIEDYEEL